MDNFERCDRITKEECLPAIKCFDCINLIVNSMVSGKDDITYGYCTEIDDVYDVNFYHACEDYEMRL